MKLLKNRLPLREKTHPRGSAGYSLIEIIVALGMSATLGIAATAVVAWTVNVSARTQANTILSAQSEKVLNKFESSLRDSDQIISVSSTQIVYTFQRLSNCELHTYVFSTVGGVTTLTHITRIAILPAGNYCSNIATALLAGSVGAQTTIVEGTNLDPSSGFNYFSADAQRTYVSGEVGYDPTTVLPLCMIGSVTMNIVTNTQTLNNGTALKTETVTAGIRANQFGLTC